MIVTGVTTIFELFSCEKDKKNRDNAYHGYIWHKALFFTILLHIVCIMHHTTYYTILTSSQTVCTKQYALNSMHNFGGDIVA